MTLITTPGATNANSLASLADAEDYMGMVQGQFKTDWLAASNEDREAALRQASVIMFSLPWIGVRATGAQPMAWPRRWWISDAYTQQASGTLYDKEGYRIDNTTIPWQVRNACCEFAFRLVSDDRQADAGGLAPTELKSGTTTITNPQRRPVPPSVLEMVRNFLTTDGHSIKLVRGS
jgi:hypothetical protein